MTFEKYGRVFLVLLFAVSFVATLNAGEPGGKIVADVEAAATTQQVTVGQAAQIAPANIVLPDLIQAGPFMNAETPRSSPNAVLLWDNTNINVTTSGIVSNDLRGRHPDSSLVNTADDFVVPAGVQWSIDSIYARGFSTVTGAVDSYAVAIYANDPANKPGTRIYYRALIPANGLPRFDSLRLKLPSPVVLNSGTYWLSVYAIYNTGTVLSQTRWNWYNGPTAVGLTAHIQDFTGLFGIPPFPWATVTSLGVANPSNHFALFGTSQTTSTSTIIYDNGPYVTAPGGGPGGTNASVLQTSLGMTTLGFGVTGTVRLADDINVNSSGGWRIDSIKFNGYTTMTTPDTINSSATAVNLRIWNGIPDTAGSSVVWGDTTTNRMTRTYWQREVRISETTINLQRALMIVNAGVGTTLPQGTYWLDWNITGLSFSPPITIPGQTTTGNGRQRGAAGWVNLSMGGTLTPQGMPFTIYGQVLTNVKESSTEVPSGYVLSQNYPNPFNPSTTIKFSIPVKERVTLQIYNTLGQLVSTLHDGELNAGSFEATWNASGAASGVYFYRLQAGNFSQTKSLVLLK
ncbi:MAG: T9SS type A sorting domain-containing protein [Bacteroidetes bacterium]|nr:T9SS type A sorting domain-containing protein [Bacteroidota bacterium]MCW5896178.1 T9SS type A sorting domain-containing protein [Bacteroidota bacterium]